MNKTAAMCVLGGFIIGFASGYGAGSSVGEMKTRTKYETADAEKDAWMRKMHVCHWADVVARDHCSVPLPHTVAE